MSPHLLDACVGTNQTIRFMCSQSLIYKSYASNPKANDIWLLHNTIIHYFCLYLFICMYFFKKKKNTKLDLNKFTWLCYYLNKKKSIVMIWDDK